MGRLTLNPSDSIGISSAPASSNLQILGSGGSKETVTIAAGVVATFSQFGGDGDTIVLAGNANDYTARLSGSQVILTTAGGTSITLPAVPTGTTLQFADATRSVAINTGAGTVEISGTGVATQTVTTTGALVTAGSGGTTPITGQTFVLTTGGDNFVGTDNNDTFNGSTTANSFSAFDNLDGGKGADTLNVLDTTGVLPGGVTVKNIETFNFNTTSAGATADVSGYTGLTTFNLTDATAGAINTTLATTTGGLIQGTGASAVTVSGGGTSLRVATGAAAVNVGGDGKANAFTSVSVTGGTTVLVSDNKTAAGDGTSITSVTLSGNTGAATLNTLGLTTLSASKNAADITTTTKAALTADLNGATAGKLTADTATTLTITNSDTASTIGTVSAAAATGLTVNGAKNVTIADVAIGKATTLTIAGAGKTTFTGLTGVASLTSIDATANTGGVTIGTALATGVSYTGGAGVDTITVGATTKAIATGAGDDVVTVTATALGTGGSVTGGDGNDTLVLTDANAVTASATTAFGKVVTGFERLTLIGTTAADQTVNLANLGNINYATIAGVNGGNTLTFSNAATGFTLVANAGLAGTAAVTLGTDSKADVLNVSVSAAGAQTINALTATGFETVNFATDDSAAAPTGIAHIVTLNDATATAITVTGDAGLTLTFAGTALTSFDASAVTKGSVSYTTGALAAASTLNGGAGNDTINAAAAVAATTINGGAGDDTLTGSSTKANTINGGDGNDAIVGGSGVDTINGGLGNDTITSGTGLDILTGGGGNDTFVLSVNANGNTYATITDANKGDILTLVNKGTETFQTAAITLASTAVFQDYLDAAAAGDGSTNGAIKWFQFGGDTYIVEDVSLASTFQNGADLIVKLTGLVDLSTATGAGTHVLTLA